MHKNLKFFRIPIKNTEDKKTKLCFSDDMVCYRSDGQFIIKMI